MEQDSLLELLEISKVYGERTVLSNVSLKVASGECVVLRGSNGSGKSTLLRIIAGLIPCSTGIRSMSGKTNIGYTPDRLANLPMNSIEYLTFMGRIAKLPGKELQDRISRLHKLFNLEINPKIKMTHFSKGMLQKVNLMQAVIKQPDLLVLDEPFSGLDKETAELLLTVLRQMQKEGTAIVAAVHDSRLAHALDGKSYSLQDGELSSGFGRRKPSQMVVGCDYELSCSLSEELLGELRERFPNLRLENKEHGDIKFTVKAEDYRELILELMEREIEIMYLKRRGTNA